MRIIIGDEVGQAKVLTTRRGHDTTLPTTPRPTTSTFFPPSRSRAISHILCPIAFQNTPSLTAVLSSGGHLRIFSPQSSPSSPKILFSHTISCAPETPATTLFLSTSADGKRQVLTAAVESGDVVYVDLTTGEITKAKIPGGGECAVIQPTRELGENGLPSAVAVARRETPGIEIYESANSGEEEDRKPSWVSKAPKNDARKLETVVLTSGIEFLGPQPMTTVTKNSPSSAPSSTESENGKGKRHNRHAKKETPQWRFVAASKDGHIRIYDTAVSRRAIWAAKIAETPIATFKIVSPLPATSSPESPSAEIEDTDNSNVIPPQLLTTTGSAPESATISFPLTIAISTLSGLTLLYSATERRQLGVFKGCEGVVKGLSLHYNPEADETLIAGVGNGRYLCVWNEDRELLARAFVKTVGSCVGVLEAEDEVEEGEKDEEEEKEDVWEGMKEVGEDVDVEMGESGSAGSGEDAGKRRRKEGEDDGERRKKKKRAEK